MKRRLLLSATTLSSLALLGCVPLGGGDTPSRVWYVLEDAGTQATPVPASARGLRVTGEPGSDFYESRALAFSRERATRAYFQYANWSESPAERIAQLFVTRLREGGAPAAPEARAMRLVLEDLYLDVTGDQAVVKLVIEARLMPRQASEPGTAQVFRIDEPAQSADAPGMAQASGRALGRAFDAILGWLGGALKTAGSSGR
ncbi:MAG: ABC-type transport auxiliary lipoprotein family protein [Burkholderiaceae bacterium]